MRIRRWRPRVRRGMAALEVVLITGLTLPLAYAVFWMVVLTVRRYFGMLGNGVGLPYF